MKTSYSLTAHFNCSLERAFKTPILGDATQFLTGYGPIPPVIRFEEDETWGKAGGYRYPIAQGNFFAKEGRTGFDEIKVRDENKYWKWQVQEFGQASLFFATKAVGEWWVKQISEEKIEVKWTYNWHARNIFTWGINWGFVKLIWGGIMRRGLKNMQKYAEGDGEWVYNV